MDFLALTKIYCLFILGLNLHFQIYFYILKKAILLGIIAVDTQSQTYVESLVHEQ